MWMQIEMCQNFKCQIYMMSLQLKKVGYPKSSLRLDYLTGNTLNLYQQL